MTHSVGAADTNLNAIIEGLEYLDHGLSIVDRHLRLVACNRRFLALLDLPPELGVPGTPMESFLRYNAQRGEYGPGDVEELVRERLALARRLEPHCFQRVRADGTVLEIRGNPLPDGGFITTYTDVTERRRVDQALQTSEQQYRTLVENLPDFVVRYDRALRRLYVNPAWERGSGLSADEVVNVMADEIPNVPQALASDYVAALKRAFATGIRQTIEFSWVNALGETLYLQYLVVPESSKDGTVETVLAVGRDISELKRAERENIANLHYFESMDHVNRAMTGSNDLERVMSDVLGIVLSAFNCDRAYLMYPCDSNATSWSVPMERTRPEYPGAQGLGEIPMTKPVADTIKVALSSGGPIQQGLGSAQPVPAEMAERFGIQSAMMMVIRPKLGKPWQFGIHQCSRQRQWTPEEERLFDKIGLRLSDALTGLLAFRSLRENELRLKEAERIAQIGYWDRDLRTDQLTVSEETYHIIGVTPLNADPALARGDVPWQRLIHPEDSDRIGQAAKAALSDGLRLDVEYRLRRLGGGERYIHMQGEVTRDGAGRPTRMFGTVQDITERKTAEDTLRRVNRELRAVSLCNQALIRAEEEHALLDEICRLVCEEAGYRMAWVGYAEHDAARTIRPVTWAGAEDGYLAEVGFSWGDMENGAGPAGKAVRSGEYACAQDFTTDPEVAPWRDSALKRGYRSVIALPLKNPIDEVFGVLVIYAEQPHFFNLQEKRLLEELAGDLAFGISVLRARIKFDQSRQDLQRTNELMNAIIEAAPVAIFGLDLDGNVHAVWNSAAERMLGWKATEVMGKKPPTVPMDKDHEFGRLRELIREGKSFHGTEVLRQRRDGSPIYYSVYASPLRDAEGRVSGNITVLVDSTQRKLAENALRSSEEKYRRIVDTANEGIWMLGPERVTLFVNARMAEMLGYRGDEIVGRPLHEFMFEEDLPELDRLLANQRPGQLKGVELRFRCRDGLTLWTLASLAHVFDDDGHFQGSFGMFTDITERKRQEEQLLYQAHYDPLTGLPNRFLSLDRLERQIEGARRHGWRTALLFLDLDDFKKVNDALGHEVGDQVLISAAARLQGAVRAEDTVGRLGGDEFIVLLDKIEDAEDIAPVAEKIVQAFQEVFPVMGRHVMLTASLGIAIYPEDGTETLLLLRNADTAMYHSKSMGRNAYHFFTDSMNKNVARRLQLEEQLRFALERDEFFLVYQPIVAVASGAVEGAEVLLRWENSQLGKVSPDEFIDVAEQSGLIIEIGDWVMTNALQQLAEWSREGFSQLRLALNVSPRQFRQVGFVELLKRRVEESGLQGTNLELEITEGVLLSGECGAAQVLDEVRRLGMGVAMDDFGTGYSSLSYLRKFPFDSLKIDRSFIRDIIEDPHDRELVLASIRMAKGLGLRVVAEGVESASQLEFLRQESCDYAQGYYFSRPLRVDDMTQILRKGALPNGN